MRSVYRVKKCIRLIRHEGRKVYGFLLSLCTKQYNSPAACRAGGVPAYRNYYSAQNRYFRFIFAAKHVIDYTCVCVWVCDRVRAYRATTQILYPL